MQTQTGAVGRVLQSFGVGSSHQPLGAGLLAGLAGTRVGVVAGALPPLPPMIRTSAQFQNCMPGCMGFGIERGGHSQLLTYNGIAGIQHM